VASAYAKDSGATLSPRKYVAEAGGSAVETLINRATELMGGRDEALGWLGTSVRALDYATPISLLGTHIHHELLGLRVVKDFGTLERGKGTGCGASRRRRRVACDFLTPFGTLFRVQGRFYLRAWILFLKSGSMEESLMEKLIAVEEAKALLTIAKDWSILQWLAEKRKVRTIADKGTAALNAAERQVKSGWSEDLRNAYAELSVPPEDSDDPFAAAEYEFIKQQAGAIPEAIRAAAQRVKEADDIATRARMNAEKTFDDAERRLSASMARRGAEEAIEAYALHYKAIDAAVAAKNAR